MALKFRRRQKIFPGFYLNFSRTGISTTIGPRGFNVNIGQKGAYLNTGIPGSGIYDRKRIGGNNKSTSSNSQENFDFTNELEPIYYLPTKLEGEIKSNETNSLTSNGLADLKETLLNAYQEKLSIDKEILEIEEKVKKSKTLKLISQILIIGLFIEKPKKNYLEKKLYLEELKKQSLECNVSIEIEIEKDIKNLYHSLLERFERLTSCYKIWDKTTSISNDDNRSVAQSSISRELTNLSLKKIEFINADFQAFYFKNLNGSDIYLYPAFAVLYDDKDNFGIVDLNELALKFNLIGFLEEEEVPIDTKIIDHTWAKTNKNGSADKRFVGNYEIPIVEYAEIEFTSKTGVNEIFMFSNTNKTSDFIEAYKAYTLDNYLPNFTENIDEIVLGRESAKTYISNYQSGSFDTKEISFTDRKILILGEGYYKIEIPNNEVISGKLFFIGNDGNKKIYETENQCPITISENEIMVNLYGTHNFYLTYKIN